MPDTNDTSATRVKNFNFDNDTSKNIFAHPYIYYMASERLQGEEQFHSKNYILEMSRFRAKMRLKSAPQKRKKFYTGLQVLGRSHIVTHSNAASFLIKTILCENTNIPFSKNY